MLKVRLQRVGRKHQPAFRVVLTDSHNSSKSGRFLEVLGSYDAKNGTVLLKDERINYWKSVGAQLSGSVNNLMVKSGKLKGKKVHVGEDFKEKVAEEAPVKEEVKAFEGEELMPEEVKKELPAEELKEEIPAEEPKEESAK